MHVSAFLSKALGPRVQSGDSGSEILKTMVDAGYKGKKTNAGMWKKWSYHSVGVYL